MNDQESLSGRGGGRTRVRLGHAVVVVLSLLLAVLLTAGTAQAAPSAISAVPSRTNPVPAGANGWTDCGPKTCTFYFTRSATRAVNKYFTNVGVPTGTLGTVICGVIGYFIKGKKTGFGAGLACSLGDRFDWPGAAADAVKANGCFQLAYPNVPGKDRTFADARPGWTTHPSYCFG